jgi:polyhydroxybutyrate depolymerase
MGEPEGSGGQPPANAPVGTPTTSQGTDALPPATPEPSPDDPSSGGMVNSNDPGTGGATPDATATTVGGTSSSGGQTTGTPTSTPGGDGGETVDLGGAGGVSPMPAGGAATAGGSGGGNSEGLDDVSPSAGCGVSTEPESGRLSIDVDGQTREYILAVPSDYDSNRPYKLVFGWHPLGGSAQQVAGMGIGGGAYYGLEGQAAGSAIFVAPEGLEFNGGSLGWANTNGSDLAFLRAMLDRFGSELCIDENRVFSTGFSFGGMMSFAVGCGMDGAIRAIAPQAGNIQVSGCEDGDAPVAVMGFHGTEDTVVSIDGGRAGRDVFVERNHCTEETLPAEPNWCDELSEGEQPCSCVAYQGCDAGYPVTWCEFNGPHTPAPNSAETIWNFFSQF